MDATLAKLAFIRNDYSNSQFAISICSTASHDLTKTRFDANARIDSNRKDRGCLSEEDTARRIYKLHRLGFFNNFKHVHADILLQTYKCTKHLQFKAEMRPAFLLLCLPLSACFTLSPFKNSRWTTAFIWLF